MGGASHQKGKERGLWFEIKCLEDVIRNKTKRGEDCKFEKKILKSYRQYSERDYSQEINQLGVADRREVALKQ